MHFLHSLLFTFGALGTLAMAAGAVGAILIEPAGDGPLTPLPTGRE